MKTSILKYSLDFYFPKIDNQGNPLHLIKNVLIDTFMENWGGVTVFPDCQGYWKHENKTFGGDYSIISSNSVGPITESQILNILAFCFRETDQVAFFYKLNGVGHIVERGED